MSSKAEESDGSQRVVRRSSRRLASTDSLTDLESRADTPVLQGRSKLDSISENATTPSKKGRSIVDTPRIAKTSVASPFRRTTRGMSQEKENVTSLTASPLPKRTTRRTASESENEEAQPVETTPALTKSSRKRKSMIVTPSVHLIEEEKEEEIGCNDETVINDELELRTRSISKSPSSPPKQSLNQSNKTSNGSAGNDANESGFALLDESQKTLKSKKTIFKNRNKETNSEAESVMSEDDINEHSQQQSPIKKFASQVRRTLQVTKTIYSDVVDRLTKSAEIPKDSPKSRIKSNDDEEQDLDHSEEEIVESSQPPPSVKNTPIHGRRSIRDGGSSSDDLKATELLIDFVSGVDNVPKTPKSAKKTQESVNKTPKNEAKSVSDSTPVVKTPQSALKTPKSAAKEVKTPQSALKTPKSVKDSPEFVKAPKSVKESPECAIVKTPQSAAKTPKSVELQKSASKTPNGNKTPLGSAKKTPKSSSEGKTVNGNRTVFADIMQIDEDDDSEMEITLAANPSNGVDMEITLNEFSKNKSITEDSTKSPITVKRTSLGQTTPGLKRPSLISYVEEQAASSPRISKGTKSSFSDEEEGKPRKSWSQSITQTANTSIDKFATGKSPKVIHSESRVLKEKSISSDESDEDYEQNAFVDDEAEVGSEDDSMNESEREYLKQNEIDDDGESLGSQDSNELEEESEDENDSFITHEEVADHYELDSSEERELESPKKRRISRIIPASSSEDEQEEPVPAKSPGKSPKSPKTPAKLSETFSDDDETTEKSPVKAKTPRKSLVAQETEANGLEEDDSAAAEVPSKSKSKRKRESYLNDSVMISKSKRARVEEESDESTDAEEIPETEKKSASKKKIAAPTFDLSNVLSKCDELMAAHFESKKAKMALKYEKKAKKLALKKQNEALAQKSDTLDSSNGGSSNKENIVKKKKKPNQKKQKHVDDGPEQKENMATSVLKAQEKLEAKREKKRLKKLQKKANPQGSETENTETDGEKKSKESKTQAAVIKTKKTKPAETVVEAPKNKKSHKQPETNGEAVVEKKKNKKRKFGEAIEHEDQEKPQAKKKLGILLQIEEKGNFSQMRATIRDSNDQELSFPMPLASQKLKKVIPENVQIEKRKKKKKSGLKKVISEPEISPPKPVWSSSGVFLEEPKSPFKFTSTDYVPIKVGAGSSTNFGVVTFGATKSKKVAQPPQDFRTQAMLRNVKNRDGSKKNIRGLLGQRNTY